MCPRGTRRVLYSRAAVASAPAVGGGGAGGGGRGEVGVGIGVVGGVGVVGAVVTGVAVPCGGRRILRGPGRVLGPLPPGRRLPGLLRSRLLGLRLGPLRRRRVLGLLVALGLPCLEGSLGLEGGLDVRVWHRGDEQHGHPGGPGPGEGPEEGPGQLVAARAEHVGIEGPGQPLGHQHRPARERAVTGRLGAVDPRQPDRGPLRQVGLPVPDDLAPVAPRGVHPDLLAGAAQLVAPADQHLRVGPGVRAPQGARGDVLDVEPPPAGLQAGVLGSGQRLRGVGGTGRPQEARAVAAGPVPAGRGEVGRRGGTGYHVGVDHAARRPGPGHLLRQARADRSRPPGGHLDDGEVHVDVGKGATALGPADVGAPAGAHGRDGPRGGRHGRGGREPGVVPLVDRGGHAPSDWCGHRVGDQLGRRGGRLG